MISFGGQEGTFVSVGNKLEGGERGRQRERERERERAAVEFGREDSTNKKEAGGRRSEPDTKLRLTKGISGTFFLSP